MSDTIKWEGYLAVAVNKRGAEKYPNLWKSSAKLSVGKPTVSRDEVAVKVSIELPVSLFQRPSLEARITVPESSVTPLVIGLDVIDNVQELIAQQTGFDVRLIPVEGGQS